MAPLDEFQAFEARRRRPLADVTDSGRSKRNRAVLCQKHGEKRAMDREKSAKNALSSSTRSQNNGSKGVPTQRDQAVSMPSGQQLRRLFSGPKMRTFQIHEDERHAGTVAPSVKQLFSAFDKQKPEAPPPRQRLISSLMDYNTTVRQSNLVIRAACDSAKLRAMTSNKSRMSGSVLRSATALSSLLIAATTDGNEQILLVNTSGKVVGPGTKVDLGAFQTHVIAGTPTKVYSDWTQA